MNADNANPIIELSMKEVPPFNSMLEAYATAKLHMENAWDKIRTDNKEEALKYMRMLAGSALRFVDQYGKAEPLSYNHTIQNIINKVAWFYEIDPLEMKSKTRKAAVVRPRQRAIYLIMTLTAQGPVATGRIFGLDHSTVSHACETVNNEIRTNKQVANELEYIKKHL